MGRVGNYFAGYSGGTELTLGANAYYSTGWKYALTGALATRYMTDNSGGHYWYTAPSGTAGNAITFTQAMTLDASGNLGIGTSSPNNLLHVATQSTAKTEMLRLQSVNGFASGAGTFIRAGSGGGNTVLFGFDYNSGSFQVQNGNTSAALLTVVNDGNVGIGTTAPYSPLTIVQSRQGNDVEKGAQLLMTTATTVGDRLNLNFSMNGVTNRARAAIGAVSEDTGGYACSLAFYARSAGDGTGLFTTDERVRITSAGNVGIGTSSPSQKLSLVGTSTLNGNGSGAQITIADTSGRILALVAPGSVADAAVGTTTNHSLNLMTGSTNRVTVDVSGNLQIGTGTQYNSARLTLSYAGSSSNGVSIIDTTNTSNTQYISFQNSAGGQTGYISRVGTTNATVYNTTSDYRLKTVTGAVTGQGARIDALKPVDYQWKEDGQTARGFLAHEFKEVYANSVSGEKDAVNANGDPVYQAMQASTPEVIADLVAEIQSLRIRLAALEAK
jgi:hypothetical protein